MTITLLDAARAEAARRGRFHREAGDYREPVGDLTGYEADLKGIMGEMAFAEAFGLPLRLDLPGRGGGDDGWDFEINLRVDVIARIFRLDVKTAAKPRWLISHTPKTERDYIYVLAHYIDDNTMPLLLGWEWGAVLMRRKPRMVGPRWVHWAPREELRAIQELHERHEPPLIAQKVSA